MSYYNMDHVAHVRSSYRQEPSELGKRVATIIGIAFGGIYNTDGADKIDWTNPRMIELRTFSSGEVATWDFNVLTKLVFLSHDLCVRMSVTACTPKLYKLRFWLRDRDADDISRGHPTIEEALKTHREAFPLDRCIQRTAKPEQEAA